MTRLFLALPLLLAASAATAQDRPARLVANTAYEARGAAPGWRLAIGDRIALRMDPDGEGFVAMEYFPRVRSRNVDGVRRWEARTFGDRSIRIEARQTPCALGETRYRDTVTVTVTQGGRRLSGCGGPRL